MAQRIPVRHPRIDLSQGFAPHWLGDDAFRSQLFNAFSMSFPIGEKYFIDTVREALPRIEDARLREDIRGFCGQEAVHSALLHTLPHWLAYLKPGFHPRQNDTDALVRDWLERNAEAFR